MGQTLYVGTYTTGESRGIYQLALEEGKLSLIDAYPAENPSYLAVKGEKLYAVGEKEEGTLATFQRNGQGKLQFIKMICTKGADPCHVSLSGDRVYVSNYSGGSLACFSLDERGLPTEGKTVQHKGSSLDAQRQNAPHVHQAMPVPEEHLVGVCDLGLDQVLFYPQDLHGPPQVTLIPPGSGPRHCAYGQQKVWYLLCELSSTLFVFQGYGECAKLLQTLPLVSPGDMESYGAAICLSPQGDTLLISLRGKDIGIAFQVDSGGLLGDSYTFSTEGAWPRDAAFSPCGEYILFACEHSHKVTLFRQEGIQAKYIGMVPVPSPTCLCFP